MTQIEAERCIMDTPTPQMMEHLACHEAWIIRYRVGIHYRTPTSVLRLLSNDSVAAVRCAVAQNPDTPVDVLEALAFDDTPNVRNHAGHNPNAPLWARAAGKMESL